MLGRLQLSLALNLNGNAYGESIQNIKVLHTKITLVIVTCSPPNNIGFQKEAVVLLKSIFMLAKLHKMKSIEFFFENIKEETEFLWESFR